MEDWNLGSEKEPSHRSSSHRADAMPRGFGLDNKPASPEELGAEDSFPVGPTLLYQAFAPMSPRSVGPGSSLRAGGRRSAGAGEELADLRTAMAAGRREPGVLSALGETLARLGRRDEAEAMFRDLLTSHPDNVVGASLGA